MLDREKRKVWEGKKDKRVQAALRRDGGEARWVRGKGKVARFEGEGDGAGERSEGRGEGGGRRRERPEPKSFGLA